MIALKSRQDFKKTVSAPKQVRSKPQALGSISLSERYAELIRLRQQVERAERRYVGRS